MPTYWGPRNNPDCEANIAALLAHWRAKGLARSCSFVTTLTEERLAAAPRQSGQRVQGRRDRRAGRARVQAHELVLLRRPGPAPVAAGAGGSRRSSCAGSRPTTAARRRRGWAGNLGYDVRFVIDATHTFDRGDLTADQLAHATATNLDGEFATIVKPPPRCSTPDLRRLRYFVAVAEDRNFTRAAQRLHVAQPALSRQIRLLENELGAQLLHRTTHDVELTEAGAAAARTRARGSSTAADDALARRQPARDAARRARSSSRTAPAPPTRRRRGCWPSSPSACRT